MNILNILNYSPEFGGGVLHHLSALGKLCVKKGDKLYIAFPKEREWQKELFPICEVIIIPEILNPLWSGYTSKLRKFCKIHSIDIIHIHFTFSQAFKLAISFKKWSIPLAYQWHNPPTPLNKTLTPHYTLNGKIKRFAATLIVRFTDRRVISQHISISKDISRQLVSNKWTTSEKITFIPNGISSVNHNYHLPKVIRKNRPVIGTVANFRPEKDYETLLKAFRLLIDYGIQCELQLVGDGPTKLSIEKLADELRIKSLVKFLGILPNPSKAYQSFDVFVLSTFYEGHSLVLMEAMSYALPIVATNVSSIPDVLDDGVNALLVNSKDPDDLAKALKNLITNNILYTSLSAASIENYKKQLSHAEWAIKVFDLYDRLVKNQ
jgi:glycosyltransferase involved in cell wall biosynthesis